MGVGQGLVSEGSLNKKRRSTFFTGFLAVVVATPCTAPFMAGALGFAFVKGGLVGMAVFLTLGFGLAFPYLLLCFVPGFRPLLPRPGAWMETMRTILGFPMFATALWLFWILGNQMGVNAMAIGVAASLLLGLALLGISKANISWKVVSIIYAIGIVYSGFFLSNIKPSTTVKEDASNAVAFSSDALRNLLSRDQSVFVYFTADWCVTCKLNERAALSQSSVQEAFIENDITVMVGDWTNQNPDITKTLQSYGRIGVPLYLYFPEGRPLNNPDILPQILTPTMVINAL
jgi:thiol:disulfide interchange protein DsbD